MERGYVPLWKCSMDSRVFQNEGLWKVWTWCLMKANHEATTVKLLMGKFTVEEKLEPGQFIFGRNTAARELSMPASTVWKRMLTLESPSYGNLNIYRDKNYSIITIINWHIYRPENYYGDNNRDNQVTTKEQLSDTANSTKSSKKKNNIYAEMVEDVIHLYNDMRPEDWPETTPIAKKVRTQIEARIKEDVARETKDWWGGYFNRVNASTLVTGDWFSYGSLEWITKKENMNQKILKARYDPKSNGRRPTQSRENDRIKQTMENLAGRSFDHEDGQDQGLYADDDPACFDLQPKLLP
jgi:hypothetical protein